tara:strand:- start:4011 stop:4178 length:168 start_codon:yes stop_codon:yes gene_type:complete
MRRDSWTPEDERFATILVLALVVVLLVIRACIPMQYHHPAERPHTPPESFYKPGK